MLVDSHCHLNLYKEPFAVIQRAKAGGVKYLNTIATDLQQVAGLISIAEQSDGVFVCAGVHPCSVSDDSKIVTTNELQEVCQHPKVIGIGETGLDYYHTGYNKSAQQQSLLNHICLSQQTGLPIIIHNRNSDDDCAQILTTEHKNRTIPGLIHCFASDLSFAKAVLDIGFYISIAGIVTFKNAQTLCDVVRYVPLDMLLLETDSPYLAPVPMRGKENEPAFVNFVAQKIAQIKNLDVSQVIKQTGDNFFNLFTKATI